VLGDLHQDCRAAGGGSNAAGFQRKQVLPSGATTLTMRTMHGSDFSPPKPDPSPAPSFDQLRAETARKLKAPAIALMSYFALVGLLLLAGTILLLIDSVGRPDAGSMWVVTCIGLVVVGVHALGFFGSLSMVRLRGFGLAVTACALAWLAVCGPLWIVGIAFSIWALVHLFDGTSRYVFRGEMPPIAALERARSSSAPVLVAIAVIAVPVFVALIGVMAALAIYGLRRYVSTAKTAEAKTGIGTLAKGIAKCYETTGSLPPSTNPVPADLATIRGQKYQSDPTEWHQPAFDCAGFRMEDPQYFQYSWELEAGGKSGAAVARGDLDGDGIVSEYRLPIVCDGDCRLPPEFEVRNPLE